MKKKISIFTGVFILLTVTSVFVSCGSKKSDSEEETTEVTTEAEEVSSETTEETTAEAVTEETTEITTETAKEETTTASPKESEAETYGEGWVYDEEYGGWYMYSVPDSVYAELAEKTGLTEEELAEDMEQYDHLKGSTPYSWDDSEAPLTDEQLKEIEAEQASILAEMEQEEQNEQNEEDEHNEQEGGN